MIEIIKKKIKTESPYYTVKMCGDYNDADYSYSEDKYSEPEFELMKECLYEIIQIVGVDYCNGFDRGETEYEFVSEYINNLMRAYDVYVNYPSGDTCGDCPIHSLESLEILYTDCDGNVFEVELVSK